MSTQPMFKAEIFDFKNGEQIPDHEDSIPDRCLRDHSLHHIEGYMPEDGDFIWLAINLDESSAVNMLDAAVRKIKDELNSNGYHLGMVTGVAHIKPDNEGLYSSISSPVSAV